MLVVAITHQIPEDASFELIQTWSKLHLLRRVAVGWKFPGRARRSLPPEAGREVDLLEEACLAGAIAIVRYGNVPGASWSRLIPGSFESCSGGYAYRAKLDAEAFTDVPTALADIRLTIGHVIARVPDADSDRVGACWTSRAIGTAT